MTEISDKRNMFISILNSPTVVRLLFVAFALLFLQTLLAASPVSGAYKGRLFWFLGSLAVAIIVCSPSWIASQIASACNTIAEWAARRGAFISNAEREMPKFAFVRILFGVFLIDRALAIAVRMPESDWSSVMVSPFLMFSLFLSILVTIGFLTQFALATLIVYQWHISEYMLGTSTLGNDIAAMLSVLLIFANAGAHYSVDSRLRKGVGLFSRLIQKTYYTNGIPADNTLQIAKILTLGAYWLVCVYSFMMHLNEEAWMTGVAGPLLLSNNFMSNFDVEFVEFFQSGAFAVHLGRISLWLMLPWYLLLLPAVLFGGYIRLYAIIWGLAFFFLSRFVLQLGWLAEFEFLFWVGLFWQSTFIGKQGDLQVAYDDRCNLCDRTVNVIRRLDIFDRVALRPLSKNKEWLSRNGVEPDFAMADLYGFFGNSPMIIKSGYQFYELLASRLLLLLPVYPILVLGRWTGIGPRIYRYIADRRTRLFGVCELPTAKPDNLFAQGNTPEQKVKPGGAIGVLFAHMCALACVYVIAIPAPFVGWSGYSTRLSNAAHTYGIAPINVFNKTDLRMAENWFTLEEINEDGAKRLLPLFDKDGHRLDLHRSDRVYFGHTLRMRRGAIDKNACVLEEYRKKLRFLAEHDLERNLDKAEVLYTQYFQPIVTFEELRAGRYTQEKPRVMCTGIL